MIMVIVLRTIGFPQELKNHSLGAVLFLFVCFFNLFLTALGLRCCARAFPRCLSGGLLFIAMCGLLIAVASLVAEHGP